MFLSYRYFLATTALAAGLAAATTGFADKLDPGFNPDTGQINPGVAIQVPSQIAEIVKIPTPQEARAAMTMPVSTQPSTGETPVAATTGAAPSTDTAAPPQPSGPIGSISQTLPAKFSQRNEVLDRLPIMGWPLALSDEQRRLIYEAVMSDKTQPAPGADSLIPTSALTTEQALEGTHEMPAGVRDLVQLNGLAYVKGKTKVLLVTPPTRTVVDEIGG